MNNLTHTLMMNNLTHNGEWIIYQVLQYAKFIVVTHEYEFMASNTMHTYVSLLHFDV